MKKKVIIHNLIEDYPYRLKKYLVTLKVGNEKVTTFASNKENAIDNILTCYKWQNYNKDWGITAKLIREL